MYESDRLKNLRQYGIDIEKTCEEHEAELEYLRRLRDVRR